MKWLRAFRRLEKKPNVAVESESEKRTDEGLHSLASRLHVLMFETYGEEDFRRRKKGDS